MASGNKRRGPKPQTGGSTSPTPKPTPAPKGAASATRRGVAWQWWVVIGVFVVAIVVGIAVQSSRSKSENSKVVTPKHALGPNHSEIEGDASAPVLIQEYADFQCPSCKRFHDTLGSTVDELVADGKIRYAYTYFPFLGPESVDAAAAAVCAGDAKKFFQYSDILYTRQQEENSGYLTQARLLAFGEEAGIKGAALTTFKACVKSKKYEGFVRRSADDASKRGVNQTPTVLATGPNGKTVELSGVQTVTPVVFKQAIADIAANKSS
jgi:protein-disulfide isomerase